MERRGPGSTDVLARKQSKGEVHASRSVFVRPRRRVRDALREKFQEALAALSEDHRSVVVLRGIEGLPFEEVSRILEIPVPTAQSRMARAKERLRELLGDYMKEDGRRGNR